MCRLSRIFFFGKLLSVQKWIYFQFRFAFLVADLWISEGHRCFAIGIQSRHRSTVGMGNRSMLYGRTPWSWCMLFSISLNIQYKVRICSIFIFQLVYYSHPSGNLSHFSFKFIFTKVPLFCVECDSHSHVFLTIPWKSRWKTTFLWSEKCHIGRIIVWWIGFVYV